MSQENVEIVRRLYGEMGEGRFSAVWHLFHPDVEYARRSDNTDVLAGEWQGREAMGKAMREWVETIDDLRIEAERFVDAGDAVVVLTRQRGTYKASGLPLDERFADVITVREGRIVRFHQYRHQAEALEAVGLRE